MADFQGAHSGLVPGFALHYLHLSLSHLATFEFTNLEFHEFRDRSDVGGDTAAVTDNKRVCVWPVVGVDGVGHDCCNAVGVPSFAMDVSCCGV